MEFMQETLRFRLARRARVRRIQTLCAFRRPNFGGLDAWRVGENQYKMEPWATPNGAIIEEKQSQNPKNMQFGT